MPLTQQEVESRASGAGRAEGSNYEDLDEDEDEPDYLPSIAPRPSRSRARRSRSTRPTTSSSGPPPVPTGPGMAPPTEPTRPRSMLAAGAALCSRVRTPTYSVQVLALQFLLVSVLVPSTSTCTRSSTMYYSTTSTTSTTYTTCTTVLPVPQVSFTPRPNFAVYILLQVFRS